MKQLFNEINKLTKVAEMGLLTKHELLFKIKNIHQKVLMRYEIGSDNYIELSHPLMDLTIIANEL